MAFSTTAEWIDKAEQVLHAGLPASWRRALIRRNGGTLEVDGEEWVAFPVQDLSDQRRAKRTASHIAVETRTARETFGFPAKAVAIGANDYGDFLILLPDERDDTMLADLVYCWRHETGELQPIGACADLLAT